MSVPQSAAVRNHLLSSLPPDALRQHTATVDEFRTGFDQRLAALARSHDVLIRGGWEDAPLREVLEGALSAYGGDPGRIALDGAAVLLPANLVVMLTLAFHELATNAAKHGALSVPGGSIRVAWKISSAGKGARRVDIIWREQGGPSVQHPGRRGFGSNLLEKILGSQSGITVRQDFQLEGLECRISVPIGLNPQSLHTSHPRSDKLPFYRLYRLNDSLAATGPMTTLEVDTDDEDIGRAMIIAASGFGAELWQGPRLVRRMPARGSNSASRQERKYRSRPVRSNPSLTTISSAPTVSARQCDRNRHNQTSDS